MSEQMPKMFIDPQRPGIIRWNDDPTAGILAGIHASEIVQAVNEYATLRAQVEELRKALERVNILASDASVLPAYEVGKVLIRISDTARSALNTGGGA